MTWRWCSGGSSWSVFFVGMMHVLYVGLWGVCLGVRVLYLCVCVLYVLVGVGGFSGVCVLVRYVGETINIVLT
jgi:hypothetical protein